MKNKIISSKQINTTVAQHLKHLYRIITNMGPSVTPTSIEIAPTFLSSTGKITPAKFAPLGVQGITSTEIQSHFPNLTSIGQGIVASSVPLDIKDIPTGVVAGVMFSGGNAGGGHNVVAGIKEALGPNNTLLGVLGGFGGLIKGNLFNLTDELVKSFRNKGGFTLLQTDRTKLKTEEQYEKVLQVILENKLDILFVIGGDDSNTNAAELAEKAIEWKKQGLINKDFQVIGVPKTIDGDLQGPNLPISFGFDTATTEYVRQIHNYKADAGSGNCKNFFIKLMGRSASHVTLEAALQTEPTIALISEEVLAKNMTLDDIASEIAKTLIMRHLDDMNHSVILFPEGLIEFIPELNDLLTSISSIFVTHKDSLENLDLEERRKLIFDNLSEKRITLLTSLPKSVVDSFFSDKDPHGNLLVSKIPTEDLLIHFTKMKIKDMKKNPNKYFVIKEDATEILREGEIIVTRKQLDKFINSYKFETVSGFCGYEGRCADPTPYDAAFTYNLGLTAVSLAANKLTGYMASINIQGQPIGISHTDLMALELRNGKETPVITKSLVELASPAVQKLLEMREQWKMEPCGPTPNTPRSSNLPETVRLNHYLPDNTNYSFGTSVLLP